jgi:molecular chaperone DnaJ
VLGVPRGAEPEQVRAAWKRLARRFHPDLNPGDARAAAAFREVSAAFEALTKLDVPVGVARGIRPPDAAPPRRGQDVHVELDVDCWTWVVGGPVALRFEAWFACAACSGIGRIAAGMGPAPCARCRGGGRVTEGGRPVTCVACEGRGVVVGRACAACSGDGRQLRIEDFAIVLPPGRVPEWRIPGLGGPGGSGGPRGDVVITPRADAPEGTWFEGTDLVTSLNLDLMSALRGGSAVIDLPAGPVTVVVPPGAAEVTAALEPTGVARLRLRVHVALPVLGADDAEAWAAAALLAGR